MIAASNYAILTAVATKPVTINNYDFGGLMMKNETYQPTPIDTADVVLSADIVELGELIAKNTHDVWAAGRIAQGWTYGDMRDDLKKETPCLVPYEALSESEKEYDRNTAMETLKLMIKLGYTITKS